MSSVKEGLGNNHALENSENDDNQQQGQRQLLTNLSTLDSSKPATSVPDSENAPVRKHCHLLQKSSNLHQSIDAVIKKGILPLAVNCLNDQSLSPLRHFHSAWLLAKITSGNASQIKSVIEAGAVPVFIKLLTSSDENVVKQAVWALGNIAQIEEHCVLLLEAQVLPPLLGYAKAPN